MAKSTKSQPTHLAKESPEELLFQVCYAPADLAGMLARSETRSKIRRLSPVQVYFSARDLNAEEIQQLLPQITEEQWTAILDLDLWTRDTADTDAFLSWQRHLPHAEDAVGRKLLRGTDLVLWGLSFARDLEVYSRVAEDEFEGEPPSDREWMVTPDSEYLVLLPRQAEKARLYRSLIYRLYELDASTARILFHESRLRTSNELEEEAYQNRKRRIEDLGFQDYFDAVEIYQYLPREADLPRKNLERLDTYAPVPAQIQHSTHDHLLLRALNSVENESQRTALFQELFFVLNKLMMADGISPADQIAFREGLAKGLSVLNLGLDWWTDSALDRAVPSVQEYYFVSLFQYGYSRLADLRRLAKGVEREPEPGSEQEAFLEGILELFPVLVREEEGKLARSHFSTRESVEKAAGRLSELD